MHFIVLLFPEITIKSDSVRRRMRHRLLQNLRRRLQKIDTQVYIKAHWSEIEVNTDKGLEMLEALKLIPGIDSIRTVQKFIVQNIEDIAFHVVPLYAEVIAHKSFAVRVSRRGKQDYKSIDVARHVGHDLLQAADHASVSLNNPEVEVILRIQEDVLFVEQRYALGLGGFPLGTQGRALSLLSGGFDSAVASFLLLKRGVELDYVFFNLGGSAHERAVFSIAEHIWQLIAAPGRASFISVPFHGVVSAIEENIPEGYKGIVLKRCMLKVATLVKSMNHTALITGEAIAQVSSQTLDNLVSINKDMDMLILRPLIVTHKLEIIRTARALGVEQIINSIPEYCGLFQEKPLTSSKAEQVLMHNDKIESDLLLHTAQSARKYRLGKDNLEKSDLIETLAHAPKEYQVIDVRHPQEIIDSPLDRADLEIAFFHIQEQFVALDQQQNYLLYCDKSVMSSLHAELLRALGFENVGIYEPRE